MNVFINFLIDHYIWFLVIAIVLFFSLIGYLVESSKLPNEEKTPKEAKPPKEVKIKEPKPKKEKKKKKKEEDILEDNTPTIEEAMKKQAMEQKFEVLDSPINDSGLVSETISKSDVLQTSQEIELPEIKDDHKS